MELIVASLRLSEPGGSETYAVTIAGQLERLGHDVTLYTREPGAVADHARESGLRVADREDALPDDPGALVVQDGVLGYELAARYPGVRQVFVAHTADYDLQRPPQIADVVAATVVLNDRIGRRLASLGLPARLTRLRQPVDIRRFVERGPLPERAQRLLIFNHYLDRQVRHSIELAAADAGIEVSALPDDSWTMTPESVLGDADIVVGYGRGILEAMACGRAAYVLGPVGGDGWVTADRYSSLEADGFAGLAFGEAIDPQRFREDLDLYSPTMGKVNRDLVVEHHRAGEHAVELVQVVTEACAGRPVADRAPLRELARMVRVQWQTDRRAHGLAAEVRRRDEQLRLAEARAAEADRARASALADVAALTARIDALKGTRRYRAATLLAAPIDALRRRAGG